MQAQRGIKMTKIAEVGKEYVLGSVVGAGLAPCQCNSEYSPKHPCRLVVTSVGRKYVKALISGYSKPTTVGSGLELNSGFGLWEIDIAKASYRAGLEARDAKWAAEGADCMLGKKRIDYLVESL